MIWTASRICRSEVPKGSPCQSPTIVRLERPSPRATRPGAMWPRLAAETPRTTGVRVWTGTTAEPTWIRSVWLAISVIRLIASYPEDSPSHAVW